MHGESPQAYMFVGIYKYAMQYKIKQVKLRLIYICNYVRSVSIRIFLISVWCGSVHTLWPLPCDL